MSAAMERLEERIAELERAADGVRAATREAHEATKELRQAEKAIRDLLKTEAHDLVKAAIETTVNVGLAAYAEEIRRAQRSAVDHVGKTFEELARIYCAGHERSPEARIVIENRLAALRHLNEEGPE